MKCVLVGALRLLTLVLVAGYDPASGETVVAGKTLKQWTQDLAAANETIRLRAAKTIGQFGAQGTEVAVSMLSHDDAAIRYWAATHLGDIGEPAASERSVLEKLKGDESAAVRLAVAYALCCLGEVDGNLPVLIRAVQSSERSMACSAADLLGRVGPPAQAATDVLLARTRDGGDYHARGAALNAMRKIKNDDPLVEHKRPLKGGNLRGWRAQAAAHKVPAGRSVPRPNILWISCEDISPNLGCYGDAYASTPNLDRLARQGARFDRAFTPAGVCAVVRSGIITGVYPISIGSHHMRSRIVPPPEIKCFSEYLRAVGYFCTNNSKTDYQFEPPPTAWDRQGADHGDWRARSEGQPFFSVINLTVSHESQIRHSEQLHASVLGRLQPEQWHDPAAAAPYHPPIYPKTPEALKDWAWYHDNISEMDRQVGDILAAVHEDGLDKNTLVVFWSDHGRGLARAKRWIYDSGVHIPMIVRWPGVVEPGSVREDLVSTQDLALTMLSLAGIKPPDYLQGRVFLGDNSQPEPQYLFYHRDRMDEAYELMRAARDRRYKYIRNYEPWRPYAQHIEYMDKMPTLVDMRRLNAAGLLRGPEKVFMQPHKPNEELYDTLVDPHETINLAESPEHQARLVEMREALNQWQVEVGDKGLVPEPVLMERMRPGNQYQRTAGPEPTFQKQTDLLTVSIHCETPGASIAYQIAGETNWKLYSRPIVFAANSKLRAQACRIGFRDSPIVECIPE